MKFLHYAFSLYFIVNLAIAAPLDDPNPDDDGADDLTSNLPKATRPPTDCGTFKFKCKNARGACNNACYFINCVNKGNNKFKFGPSPVDNRVHSGCKTTKSSTICKLMPLSQRMWDRQPDDLAAKPLQCDEFPMNAFKQDAFKEGDTPRNSLRCINGPENGSGGGQFKNFKDGTGDWKVSGPLAGDRKCPPGPMIEDDTFAVEWIIDGDDGVTDQDKFVPYCKPNPDCKNDGYQFHMSKLQIPQDGKSGSMSSPYNYPIDNHYAITSKSDIMQYRVKIDRISDQFNIEVFIVNGADEVSKGKKTDVMKKGGQIEVIGLPKSLFVFSTGDIGTKVDFTYAKPGTTFLTFDWAGGDFSWDTEDKGIAGAYCQVGGVNMIGNSEQHIQCDFPGFKDA